MKAEELDKIFDEGKEDILPYLGLALDQQPRTALALRQTSFTYTTKLE